MAAVCMHVPDVGPRLNRGGRWGAVANPRPSPAALLHHRSRRTGEGSFSRSEWKAPCAFIWSRNLSTQGSIAHQCKRDEALGALPLGFVCVHGVECGAHSLG